MSTHESRFQFRLPTELARRLQKAAEVEDRSEASLVRRAIESECDRILGVSGSSEKKQKKIR